MCLSFWSFQPKLAGMDGNRTHPGRLNSALQTVLKTGGPPSMNVHQRPLEIDRLVPHSVNMRPRARMSVILAVMLAVIDDMDCLS